MNKESIHQQCSCSNCSRFRYYDGMYCDFFLEKYRKYRVNPDEFCCSDYRKKGRKQKESVKQSARQYGKTNAMIRSLSVEIDQLKRRVSELEASNAELLDVLEACCIATQGKQKEFCECFQHDSRPCLDMECVCWFGESGNCRIWKAIQKARGPS